MPEIAAGITDDEIDEVASHLTDRRVLSDMAWVLQDWNNLTTWLTDHGAPTERKDELLPTSIERVKWVIEHVEKATLVGD